jgi:EmrB/QacA subfamily drug resistance transporter
MGMMRAISCVRLENNIDYLTGKDKTMMETVSIQNGENKRIVLIITTLATFLTSFGMTSINIALPTIGHELFLDAVFLSWLVTVFIFASAAFLVPFGKIADIYGRKRIFTYGLLAFTVASIGSAISNSGGMLICCRVLQGIGSGANYCVGVSIVTSVFSSRELGRVFGINLTAVYLGQSLGPSLGGFLTEQMGWRSLFVVNVVLGMVLIVLIFWKLKGEWYEAREEKFDLFGSIIYSSTLLFIMYGFSQLSEISGVWLILLGTFGIFAFLKWEAKVNTPVLNMNLLKNNRVFTFSILATLFHYSGAFAITFLPSLYLQYIKHLTPETAGLILVSQPVVQALLSPIAGKVSDRAEPRIVASMGMVVTAVGLFLFTFLSPETTLGFVVASLVLLGVGFAFFASPNMNAVMGSVENKSYGVASGTVGTMRMVGMSFSMGITIVIFSMFIGKVQITPEYYPLFLKATKIAFTSFAVLCLLGAIISYLAKKR